MAVSAASAQAPDIPADLPRYEMDVRLDVAGRKAVVKQRTTFTNTQARPAADLAFHVYPRYRIPPEQYRDYTKLAQFMLLDPFELIDKQGRRLTVNKAAVAGRPVEFSYHPVLETILQVRLNAPVPRNGSVTIELEWELSIPDIQGKTCHWRGVTSLVNWYPTLCVYGGGGWELTPYVPWHQPFHNEMGVYDVSVTLPADQVVGGSGEIVSELPAEPGWKTVAVRAAARDFGFVCSNRFKKFEAVADGVRLRVLAFAEHEFYARYMLQVLEEVFPLYNKQLGRYPFAEFEVIESWFGHNGNESSGFVLIDQRIFAMPWILRRFVDNLVSHETLHQWWYNLVGTNGFLESWMDEGIATHLTNSRMRAKYGVDSLVFQWPPLIEGLPNLGNEDLSQKGYYRRIVHGKDMPCVQPLSKFGGLEGVLDIVYDKGGHVVGMIHYRMGSDEFFRFLREVQVKYRYRILTVALFRAELERFTGRSWERFFAQWVYGVGVCDWALENVGATGPHTDGLWRLSFEVVQKGDFAEPVNVGINLKGGNSVAVRVDPERALPYVLADPGARVERVNSIRLRVTVRVKAEPEQVEIDPRFEVLDPHRHNNRRFAGIEWRLSPLYITPDDEAFFNPFHKLTLQWAPTVENDMEDNQVVGWKAGVVQAYRYRAYTLAGVNPESRELVTGGKAELYTLPLPNTTLGVEYVRGLSESVGDRTTERGRVYLRWSERRFTSTFYPDPHFIEAYAKMTRYTNVDDGPPFAPPGIEPLVNRAALGLRYRADSRMPYWDPVNGELFTLNAESGGTALGADESYHAFSGEFSAVRKLPDCWGWAGQTKIAARIKGGWGAPDHAQIFQFGGAKSFRGLYPTRRQGNAYWLTGIEWRFPITDNLELDAPWIDNVFLLKRVHGAVFYEVGDVYQMGRSAQYQFGGGPSLGRGKISHGIGAGLHLDVTMFSLLERTQFRIDVAKDLSSNEGATLWFSMEKAF